jgi:hypothetical protein
MGPGSLFHLSRLHFFETLRLGRSIETSWEQFAYGALMPSTNWAFFGIVPWLALFALIHGPSRRAIVARCQVDPAFTALVLAPGTYVAGALLTAPLGMDLFIQNARYPLTFVTGWGLLATAWIASLDFTGASAPRAVKWRRWGLAAVLVLATGQMLYEVRRTARVRRALVRSAEGPTDEFNARKAIRAAEPWLAPDQAILSFRQSDWGVFGPSRLLKNSLSLVIQVACGSRWR